MRNRPLQNYCGGRLPPNVIDAAVLGIFVYQKYTRFLSQLKDAVRLAANRPRYVFQRPVKPMYLRKAIDRAP